MNIGIVGLGLIGGSMARSITGRTSHTVWGADRDPDVLAMAKMTGVISGELTDEVIPCCDLVLLAVRPGAAIAWTEEHAGLLSHGAVLVDLCGVKRVPVAAITPLAERYGFRYVGGHPMAGKEVAGFANSSPHLYEGASMILTPDAGADLPLLEMLRDFFYSLGFARMTFTTPEVHDRVIAYTSQLAHLTSSAYVKSPDALRQAGFSAGSFRDMTRVAKLDEDMWTELFLDNADYLLEQADLLAAHLDEYREALRTRDAERLHALLKEGREIKESAGGR